MSTGVCVAVHHSECVNRRLCRSASGGVCQPASVSQCIRRSVSTGVCVAVRQAECVNRRLCRVAAHQRCTEQSLLRQLAEARRDLTAVRATAGRTDGRTAGADSGLRQRLAHLVRVTGAVSGRHQHSGFSQNCQVLQAF